MGRKSNAQKEAEKLAAEVVKTDQKAGEATQDSIPDEKKGATRISLDEMRKLEAKAHLRDKPSTAELPPLEADQKYFEAPDGTVIVGESKANRIWYRNLHGNGKGGWISAKR